MKKKPRRKTIWYVACCVLFGVIFIFLLLRFQPQTQQLVRFATQLVTQQSESSAADLDKKNLQRLTQGCLSGNDCIPTINEPKYVSVRQAKFLKPDDLVIGVAFENWKMEDDAVRAYPLKILNWHEVVNTYINENPITVTYSSLTMTPRVYQTPAVPKGFSPIGVSGMMLNSNPVLYDQETKSLWSQFDGVALSGPERGKTLQSYENGLEAVPVKVVRWADWVKEYPRTEVLSTDTGYSFDYNKFPYGDYEKNAEILFPLENSDNRLPAKEVIFGIEVDGRFKVYPQSELKKTAVGATALTDEFASKKLTLTYAKNVLQVVDQVSGKTIPNVLSYYFAWAAFHPNTEIYRAPEAKSVK